jgi:hypothetical protein
MEKPESASGRQHGFQRRDIRAKRPKHKWGSQSTPSELQATANLVTSQKKRKRNRKRLRYPQHEASSFSAAAFRGQVTQEVRRKNRIAEKSEKQVTTQDFQPPLISARGGRMKIHRIRKTFRFIQTDNLHQIIVPINRKSFGKVTNNYHKQSSTAETLSSNSDTTESATTTTEDEQKSTETKKPKKKRHPKTNTTVETTTDYEFTEESINGSTAGVKDFNNFDISSEKPATMGFNIDEEFTGTINFVTVASNAKKAITSKDSKKIKDWEGFLKKTFTTVKPRIESDIQKELNDIIQGNNKLAERESKLKNQTKEMSSNGKDG